MLRRALGRLVVKKRAAVTKANQRSWQMNDLLFISAYGEDNNRAITFAHFSQDKDAPGELPVLKVIDWDDADTVSHVADVHRSLTTNLRWPERTADISDWRQQWASAFTLRHREVITTTEQLVDELARLATGIRDAVLFAVSRETEKGSWRRMLAAFQATLIHDLDAESFADVIAQTISYGLLTARFSTPDPITLQNLVDMVPRTNPFLKELLGDFVSAAGRRRLFDVDEVGINEVVTLLNRANAEAIKRDFNNKTRGEDPVIHFYEHFLSAYNKKLKVERGVFYTPQPVVSYIVRSVHELLQTEFGLADGLADTTTWGEMVKKRPGLRLPPLTDEPRETRTISPDEPFIQILDPATGTGTFLVEAIDVIYHALEAKWKRQHLTGAQQSAAWNDYVPKHLLPRLHAFELMMAPYAIAHMKIGLKLAETGYQFGTEERARIFLTNALEPSVKQLPLIGFDALAHEAAAVNEIKQHKRFTVVIGNPPYSGHSANNQLAWIVDKVHDYKRGLPDLQKPGQAKWLQDDYVKFLRFAEWTIQESAIGIVGMITNHSFLDNPTFRGMRRSLINSFSSLRFLDLHGNTKGREKHEGVSEDKNVFDIQQGVAVSLLAAGSSESGTSYGELWGTRDSKYGVLQNTSVRSIPFEHLAPVPEYYLFIRQNADLRTEYENGISIHKVMGENGDPAPGIVTTQDEFAIAYTKAEMREHIAALMETKSEEDARELFRLCTQDQWNYANAKRELKKGEWVNEIEPILYRPFDMRWTVFNSHVAVHRRLRVMRHLRAWKNLALVTTRSVEIGRGFEHVFCTRGLIQHHTVSLKEVNFVFPLYLRPDPNELGFSQDERINLSPEFLSRLSSALRIPQGKDGLPQGLTAEEIFHYVYSVLHSPGYRSRYAEFLKGDFPRLPLTANLDLFRALARLGGELVALHLLESPRLEKPITEFIGGRNPEVEKATWSKKTIWIDNEQTIGFKGVPEDVWNFHIGGYQVCDKWLKDRKGRKLTKGDIERYHWIVIALHETIRIMAEIDKVIDKQGGWPIK